MGLFDIFSSKPGVSGATNARDASVQGFDDAQDTLKKYLGKEVGATNTGYDAGIDYTNTGFDDATGAVNNAYDETQGFLGDAHNYLDTGTDQAVGAFDNSNNAWQGIYDTGMAGVDRYGTLAGLNGGQAGMDAFMNSPDYMLSRQAAGQGLDAIGRSFAGSGQVGRSMTDAMDYMHKYDTSILNNERNALNPYFGFAQAGAGGLGQNAGQISDLYANLGRDHANVSGREADAARLHGGDLSDLATGRGDALKDLSVGRGTDLANLYGTHAGNSANIDMLKGGANADFFKNKFAAENTANKNKWDAIMGVGNMVAGMV